MLFRRILVLAILIRDILLQYHMAITHISSHPMQLLLLLFLGQDIIATLMIFLSLIIINIMIVIDIISRQTHMRQDIQPILDKLHEKSRNLHQRILSLLHSC